MNGKKGSFEINIPSSIKGKKPPEASKKSGKSFSCKNWIWNAWEFCKEDSNRVLFSLKVGLAVLLVSLLILFQAPYDVFGTNIIWSILTVAIMFEYTVGMYMHACICQHTFTFFPLPDPNYFLKTLSYMHARSLKIVKLIGNLLLNHHLFLNHHLIEIEGERRK
jgi:hypothetical protein